MDRSLEDFQSVIRRLVGSDGSPPLSGIGVGGPSTTTGDRPAEELARANAAFLLSLCGGSDEVAATAALEAAAAADSSSTSAFLLQLARRVRTEQLELGERHPEAARKRQEAATWARDAASTPWNETAQKVIWGFLFPQGAASVEDPDGLVAALTAQRTVRVTEPNPTPLTDPISELLVTANVLLSLPADPATIDDLPLSDELCSRLRAVAKEEQRYWFDHPIPIGIETEANEIIYGLRGLNDAVAIEKQRGNAAAGEILSCALSVSNTHTGLKTVALDYLRESLAAGPALPHLNVYVFTEAAVERLLDEVLAPLVGRYADGRNIENLRRVFGVDGQYGRHYSFLKAIAAFWHVLVDPRMRATFKIDLDQVFAQAELVAESGASAFEHFRSPLWGARGKDADGETVELGMLAGALVNEKDIGSGLFTPDVTRPATIPAGEAVAFFNRLPMALSTEAEMMTRYDAGPGNLDGRTSCLQRIHVTGGTNGIMVDALRRHRPFVPEFIGRAEDQAYLLSVLFASPVPLRYVHAAGLIMRHDKEAFAGHAIEAAKVGRFVGDLARTLHYSAYVEALPWPEQRIKATIDPFTGCFASAMPITLVALRLALHVGELLGRGDTESAREACEVAEMASDRLTPLLEWIVDSPSAVTDEIAAQRDGWDLYYDTLDAVEHALGAGEPEASAARDAALAVIADCQVSAARS